MYQLGIADDEFIRGKVPMTKQEMRILSLVKAQIAPDAVVYDIGAGTGSISIEAARLAPQGMVYSVEQNPEGVSLIRENAARFAVDNIKIIEAYAPDGLEDIPALDAVIIGGSGGRLAPILDCVDKKLKADGRIVINCITLQTIAECIEYMRRRTDYSYEAVQVQVNQLHQLGRYDMAKANNPIFIITCVKKGGK